MTVWVCLMRGINVGGKNTLPMADLKRLMEKLGAQEVATYIQSGNAVFTGTVSVDVFEDLLEIEINAEKGFRPRTMLVEGDDLAAALEAFPYPEAEGDPKTGHIWVCSDAPDAPDLALLEDLAKDSERFSLSGRFFYLHAPEGIGRSKLAERVERALGVPTTARNLNTMRKLTDMVAARQDGDDGNRPVQR